MLYVGVDAHKRSSHVAVMDQAGKVLKSVNVPSTREGLSRALSRYRTPMRAVVEASYAWEPIHDWLAEWAEEVTLAHPLRVRAIASARVKTDKIDAQTLAHLLRADLIPAAYVPGRPTRDRKRVLRQRRFLVMVGGMIKNRVAALLTRNAVKRPELSDPFGKQGWAFLEQVALPRVERQLLDADLALLEQVRRQVKATERLIAELAEGDAAVGWLRSLPGVGAFLSVLIRYEIDAIARFPTPKKLCAYAGLVPSTYQSADRLVHGKLTKQGNKHLRWAMIEAVSPAVRKSDYIRRYYQRLKGRVGTAAARVATARKLLELVWTVWTEGRCYQER